MALPKKTQTTAAKPVRTSEIKMLFHAVIDTLILSGTEVLSAVSGHGGAKSRHWLGRKLFYLHGGSERGNNTRAKGVDGTLQNHGSNRSNGKIQSHRKTDAH